MDWSVFLTATGVGAVLVGWCWGMVYIANVLERKYNQTAATLYVCGNIIVCLALLVGFLDR